VRVVAMSVTVEQLLLWDVKDHPMLTNPSFPHDELMSSKLCANQCRRWLLVIEEFETREEQVRSSFLSLSIKPIKVSFSFESFQWKVKELA
jgi:hypothetical protein